MRSDRLGEDPSKGGIEADGFGCEHADLLEETPLCAGD
jgi:hypothetical protein